MRYGVCVGDDTEKVKLASEYGFDYVESGFQFFARGEKEKIDEYIKTLEECNIKCEAVNCFMPSDLPVTGDNVDYKQIADFVKKGMENGSKAGVKTVVFGSSRARLVPKEYSYDKAFRQLVFFLKEIVSPIAAQYDITVVTEPLTYGESDIICTLNEGAMLAAAVDKENIKGLGDLYHMQNAGDTAERITHLHGIIKHAHISYPFSRDGKKRVYPASKDEYDYKSFTDALISVDCPRCSIEAGTDDFKNDAKIAIEVLRSL